MGRPPSATKRMAWASSLADAWRWAGRNAIARRTIRSSSRGTSGTSSRGVGGLVRRAASSTSADTVVAGAYGEASSATGVNGNQADNSLNDAGAAYVFDVSRVRPSLWPLNAPQIGSNYTLAIDNMVPFFNLAILAFGFTQYPLPGIDLGLIFGMPCCDLYQLLDILITAPLGAGGSTTWTWTPVTGSVGDTFYCQAFCLDPTANAFGFTISNQITIKLVP